MLSRFKKSNFLKNSAILMFGTIIAQTIPTLISPLLTRLYSPESFGTLMVFVSAISIISVLATMRYEKAVVVVPEYDIAKKLTVLSFFIVILFCILLSFVNILGGSKLLTFLNLSSLTSYSWLIIIGVLLIALDQIFYHWANRISAYKTMAIAKVGNNLSSGISSIIFGLFHLEVLGLLFSKLLGLLASFIINFGSFPTYLLKAYTKKDLKEIAIKNNKYPKYIMPGHLLNAVSLNGPPIIMAMYFAQKEIGFFALTQRVIMLPVSIISRSVADVFRQKATELYNTTGNFRTLYLKTLGSLSLLGLIPTAILTLLGPWLFSIFFGAEWVESGYLAQILAFLFYFQFISSPLTSVFIITDKQQLELIWQILFLVASIASIYLGFVFFGDLKSTIGVFVIFRSIVYIISIILTLPLTVKN